MDCPKCGSADCTKDGIVKARQRYGCKSCGFRHTVQHRGISPGTKRQALQLYLGGLGFRSIGRFLKCRHVPVYNWIKAHGEPIAAIRSAVDAVELVELDEMHTYVGSKKTIAGQGLLLIDMGGDSPAAKRVPATRKPDENSGTPSKTTV